MRPSTSSSSCLMIQVTGLAPAPGRRVSDISGEIAKLELARESSRSVPET